LEQSAAQRKGDGYKKTQRVVSFWEGVNEKKRKEDSNTLLHTIDISHRKYDLPKELKNAFMGV